MASTLLDEIARVSELLRCIPVGPVELTNVAILSHLDREGSFARLVAPHRVDASDVRLTSKPSQFASPGASTTICSLDIDPRHPSCGQAEQLELLLPSLAQHVRARIDVRVLGGEAGDARELVPVARIDAATACIELTLTVPVDAPSGAVICLRSLAMAGQPLPLGTPLPQVAVFVGPPDLTPSQSHLLQTWIGGASNPAAWHEVYRGTRDGFGAASFHACCDGKARLLVLVREKEHGWLFGGFTAIGFETGGSTRYYADPSAFLFTLVNSIGKPPERFWARNEFSVCNRPTESVHFGDGADLTLCDNADTVPQSCSTMGYGYGAAPERGVRLLTGARDHTGWLVSEVVAFTIPA